VSSALAANAPTPRAEASHTQYFNDAMRITNVLFDVVQK
jgi:hypothetical protein